MTAEMWELQLHRSRFDDLMQADSDRSFRAEVRLIAPFDQVLINALAVKKFQTVMLPEVPWEGQAV